MSKAGSPDRVARVVSLVALILTGVSLYFTNRAYMWQKRVHDEELQDKVTTRFGFKVVDGKGAVTLEVVNAGTRPVYIKSVQMLAPNGCQVIEEHHTSAISDDDCWIPFYGNTGTVLMNPQPIYPPKQLAPGEATKYSKDWDFEKSPIQKWMQNNNALDRVWVEVTTTRNGFKQHPEFAWSFMGGTPKWIGEHPDFMKNDFTNQK
jgi:hypothetical protein